MYRNINFIAMSAAEGGHKDIVEDMIQRGVRNFNGIARSAARRGHKQIVEDMIQKGARRPLRYR